MKFRLKNSDYRALFWIFIGIGNVCFGASLAAVITLPVEQFKLVMLILELGFAVFSWILSLLFARKGKI